MERILIITEDGSHTIEVPALHTNYHSSHGAVNESLHVFIRAGAEYFLAENDKKNISIFEAGFGTGLNALLTFQLAAAKNITVYYRSAELYPLQKEEYERLNYCNILQNDLQEKFLFLHDADWEKDIPISENFILHKSNISLTEIKFEGKYDVVFFDAFDANVQPELWTETVFEKIYDAMNSNGVLVTYSSKGSVRRALIAAVFRVEKLAGPKGKREMLRAIKL